MAASRRGPGARPSGSAGTRRRPATRSGPTGGSGGSATRSTRRRTSVESARQAATPAPKPKPKPQPAAQRKAARTANRPSVTGRAAVLALVLAILLVSYAYPLRTWYEQHAERNALEAEADELRASVEQLEAELRLWDDPAYVRAQARERLGFVLPGEQGYVVVPEDSDADARPPVGADGLPPAGEGEWHERLWASLEAADTPPPEETWQ